MRGTILSHYLALRNDHVHCKSQKPQSIMVTLQNPKLNPMVQKQNIMNKDK